MKTPPQKQTDTQNDAPFISWFEIPVSDFDRALIFYNTVFKMAMKPVYLENYTAAYFPSTTGISGALMAGEGCEPSNKGSLLYLNAGGEIKAVLTRIEENGGRVLRPKTFISDEVGYFGLFLDSEGNKIALHSKK